MNERFAEKMRDPQIAKDTVTLGAFIGIWCDGHHRALQRRPVETDGATLGIYGRKRPILCEECESHLAYAEKRRAYCNQDPKPFCAYCEVHCYRSDEREWQRDMMRYSGPRSWRKGYALEGIRHVLEGRTYRKLAEEKARAAATQTQEEST
jgi:hypothetical protein